ncbi:MAG: hypothetical protein ACKOEW_06965 [Methylocystis sp.]
MASTEGRTSVLLLRMSTAAFYEQRAVDVRVKRLNYNSINPEANMASSDPYKDINTIIKIAFIVALILGSYNLWSFFNSSRYQALCGASFWELNRTELESCLDQKKELDK